jgi:hypothetical protein
MNGTYGRKMVSMSTEQVTYNRMLKYNIMEDRGPFMDILIVILALAETQGN